MIGNQLPDKRNEDVIQSVDLFAVRLLKVSSELRETQSETEIKTRLSISHKTKGSEIRTRPDGKRYLVGVCEFDVSPGSDSKIWVSITVVMQAFYRLENDSITIEDCESFIQYNVVFNLWPYFRELVQSLSARMLINPPIVIPLMKSAAQVALPQSQGEVRPDVQPVVAKPKRTRKKKVAEVNQ